MNLIAMVFQVEIPGGTTTVTIAVAFLAIFLAFAYVAFRVLKKTIKMSIRLAVVAAILAIAVVGSISIWWFATGSGTQRPRPAGSRTR